MTEPSSRLAIPDDEIPIVDVAPFFAGKPGALEAAADKLRRAQEEVGFYYLVGHGVPQSLVDRMFADTARFHALPLEKKLALKQNVHNVGYMPFKGSVTRANALDGKVGRPNLVEAFFIKRDLAPDHPDVLAGRRFRGTNQWPDPADLPGFRETCLAYADALERLGKRMLPIYATALGLPPDYFDAGFADPMFTLRLSHYPPVEREEGEFGLAPHTDTSFLTFLAQNEVPGLSIRVDGVWLDAPVVPGAFVVNSGNMLRRWTNDRFLSTPHRAINGSGQDRYAIPFFFDCNIDWTMACLPTCQGPDNPPRYEPITYLEYMTGYTTANYAAVRASAEGDAGRPVSPG